jgi:hypothetical protein
MNDTKVSDRFKKLVLSGFKQVGILLPPIHNKRLNNYNGLRSHKTQLCFESRPNLPTILATIVPPPKSETPTAPSL